MGIIKNKKSFTLIEMIVTVGTIGILLPIIFNIIFTIVSQQLRIKKISEVKREGDYIINSIKNAISNYAVSIHSGIPNNNIICNTILTSNPITPPPYFKTKQNAWFRYDFSNNKITSSSSQLTQTINLNSNNTLIENFSLRCSRSNIFSPPMIEINFDICYREGTTCSSNPSYNTTLNYNTFIKLKSY